MNKKLLLVGLGVLLISSSFFAGITYKKLNNKNNLPQNNSFLSGYPTVNQNMENCLSGNSSKKTLTDIILTYNPFSLGEERQLERLTEENVDQTVGIGLIDEIKYIIDDKNKVSYKFYRAGQGDVPPHYSSGRVILWAQTIEPPRYIGGLFDTEITEIEPFGTIELVNDLDGVILNCSKQSAINISDCKYSVSFNKETMSLSVKKIK